MRALGPEQNRDKSTFKVPQKASAFLQGSMAVMMALRARDRGQARGQVIDLSLLEPIFGVLGPEAAIYRETHARLAHEGGTVQMLARIGYGPEVPVSPRWPLEAKLGQA